MLGHTDATLGHLVTLASFHCAPSTHSLVAYTCIRRLWSLSHGPCRSHDRFRSHDCPQGQRCATWLSPRVCVAADGGSGGSGAPCKPMVNMTEALPIDNLGHPMDAVAGGWDSIDGFSPSGNIQVIHCPFLHQPHTTFPLPISTHPLLPSTFTISPPPPLDPHTPPPTHPCAHVPTSILATTVFSVTHVPNHQPAHSRTHLLSTNPPVLLSAQNTHSQLHHIPAPQHPHTHNTHDAHLPPGSLSRPPPGRHGQIHQPQLPTFLEHQSLAHRHVKHHRARHFDGRACATLG
jgi:hypothetical protein